MTLLGNSQSFLVLVNDCFKNGMLTWLKNLSSTPYGRNQLHLYTRIDHDDQINDFRKTHVAQTLAAAMLYWPLQPGQVCIQTDKASNDDVKLEMSPFMTHLDMGFA